MTSTEMFVQRGQYVPEHERFECYSGSVLELDTGDEYECFTRTFECACGNQMHDGDPFVRNEHGDVAHARCAHLLENVDGQ